MVGGAMVAGGSVGVAESGRFAVGGRGAVLNQADAYTDSSGATKVGTNSFELSSSKNSLIKQSIKRSRDNQTEQKEQAKQPEATKSKKKKYNSPQTSGASSSAKLPTPPVSARSTISAERVASRREIKSFISDYVDNSDDLLISNVEIKKITMEFEEHFYNNESFSSDYLIQQMKDKFTYPILDNVLNGNIVPSEYLNQITELKQKIEKKKPSSSKSSSSTSKKSNKKAIPSKPNLAKPSSAAKESNIAKSTTPVTPAVDLIGSIVSIADSTSQHGKHKFDVNCSICMQTDSQITMPSSQNSTGLQVEVKTIADLHLQIESKEKELLRKQELALSQRRSYSLRMSEAACLAASESAARLAAEQQLQYGSDAAATATATEEAKEEAKKEEVGAMGVKSPLPPPTPPPVCIPGDPRSAGYVSPRYSSPRYASPRYPASPRPDTTPVSRAKLTSGTSASSSSTTKPSQVGILKSSSTSAPPPTALAPPPAPPVPVVEPVIVPELYSDNDPKWESNECVSSCGAAVWRGDIAVAGGGEDQLKPVETAAVAVSGADCASFCGQLSTTITISGRVVPSQADTFINDLRCQGLNSEILIVRFVYPTHGYQRTAYRHLFKFLNRKNKYGVVRSLTSVSSVSTNCQTYVLALPSHQAIPQCLLPFSGEGLPVNRTHILLAVIIRVSGKMIRQSSAKNMPSLKDQETMRNTILEYEKNNKSDSNLEPISSKKSATIDASIKSENNSTGSASITPTIKSDVNKSDVSITKTDNIDKTIEKPLESKNTGKKTSTLIVIEDDEEAIAVVKTDRRIITREVNHSRADYRESNGRHSSRERYDRDRDRDRERRRPNDQRGRNSYGNRDRNSGSRDMYSADGRDRSSYGRLHHSENTRDRYYDRGSSNSDTRNHRFNSKDNSSDFKRNTDKFDRQDHKISNNSGDKKRVSRWNDCSKEKEHSLNYNDSKEINSYSKNISNIDEKLTNSEKEIDLKNINISQTDVDLRKLNSPAKNCDPRKLTNSENDVDLRKINNLTKNNDKSITNSNIDIDLRKMNNSEKGLDPRQSNYSEKDIDLREIRQNSSKDVDLGKINSPSINNNSRNMNYSKKDVDLRTFSNSEKDVDFRIVNNLRKDVDLRKMNNPSIDIPRKINYSEKDVDFRKLNNSKKDVDLRKLNSTSTNIDPRTMNNSVKDVDLRKMNNSEKDVDLRTMNNSKKDVDLRTMNNSKKDVDLRTMNNSKKDVDLRTMNNSVKDVDLRNKSLNDVDLRQVNNSEKDLDLRRMNNSDKDIDFRQINNSDKGIDSRKKNYSKNDIDLRKLKNLEKDINLSSNIDIELKNILNMVKDVDMKNILNAGKDIAEDETLKNQVTPPQKLTSNVISGGNTNVSDANRMGNIPIGFNSTNVRAPSNANFNQIGNHFNPVVSPQRNAMPSPIDRFPNPSSQPRFSSFGNPGNIAGSPSNMPPTFSNPAADLQPNMRQGPSNTPKTSTNNSSEQSANFYPHRPPNMPPGMLFNPRFAPVPPGPPPPGFNPNLHHVPNASFHVRQRMNNVRPNVRPNVPPNVPPPRNSYSNNKQQYR